MIKLVLLVIINLVLAMVKVAWFLGPSTFTPRKLIAGFMVAILYHLRVGIINLRVIENIRVIFFIIFEEG